MGLVELGCGIGCALPRSVLPMFVGQCFAPDFWVAADDASDQWLFDAIFIDRTYGDA